MKGIFALVAIIGIVNAAFGQTGTIRGTVKTSDGEPAEYVNISLKGTSIGASANREGKYEIHNVGPGNYTVVASFIGLETQEKAVSVEDGKMAILDFQLKESATKLKEVVVSGTNMSYRAEQLSPMLRLQAPLMEVPQNIQVITKDVISDQQATDMLEGVARNVSGAQMIEHWGNFARINMRGFKLPAFRNGMNVEMPWGPLTEDMSMVERIEFVKGPSGFMLSAGEPGGFYNVVTKKPTLYHRNEVSLMTGSFNTLRTTADIGGKVDKDGKLLYRLNLMGSLRGSHRPYEFNNRYTIAPSLKYQINEHTSVTAEYTYQYSQMSVVGAAYVFSANGYGDLPRDFTTAEPNIDPTEINEHSTFINMNHKINDDWQVTAQVAYINYKQMGSSLWPLSVDAAGNLQRGIDIWDALNESKLGQVFINGEVETGPVHHRMLGGVDVGQKDYYADWHQGGLLAGQGNPLNIYHPVHGVPTDSIPVFDRSKSIRERAFNGYFAGQSQRYSSLYLQDELGFFQNRVRLTLAGRFTAFESAVYGATTSDEVFSPRAGISVSITKNTSVYALYDQSFLPQTGADVNGNAFGPVTADDLEGGVKKSWFNGRLNTSAGVFYITKNNVLTADPNNINFSIQVGEVVSQGVEFDLQGRLLPGLDAVLNYAFTDVEVTKDTDPLLVGSRVAGHSKHITNGWLSYRLQNTGFKGLGLSIGYQYLADRSSWNWGSANVAGLPDYLRLDGAVSWQNEDFTIGLNVYNLLNDYLYSGSAYASFYYWQTEPGTNFRLTVKYRF